MTKSATLHKKLGTMLKDRRIKRGLSQKEVSDELGYSSSQFISNWERGLCSPPLEALGALTKLYNIRRSELIDFMVNSYRQLITANLSASSGSSGKVVAFVDKRGLPSRSAKKQSSTA